MRSWGACVPVLAAMLAACSGGVSTSYEPLSLSETEIAAALVGAGLNCTDSDTPVAPAEGVSVTRWDCLQEGSEHPYYDVLLYSGPQAANFTLERFCSDQEVGATNHQVVQLSAANFDMYNSAAVEIGEDRLTSVEVANVNSIIEPVLRRVGAELGIEPKTIEQLCD